jgi:hypothetical protein
MGRLFRSATMGRAWALGAVLESGSRGHVSEDDDPSVSPSPKLVIANYYAIRSWPEQRELCGPLAESTFGSMIPPSRLQARLRSRCKRTPNG